MSVVIRERSQPIELLLAGSIPEAQFNVHIVDKDV